MGRTGSGGTNNALWDLFRNRGGIPCEGKVGFDIPFSIGELDHGGLVSMSESDSLGC